MPCSLKVAKVSGAAGLAATVVGVAFDCPAVRARTCRVGDRAEPMDEPAEDEDVPAVCECEDATVSAADGACALESAGVWVVSGLFEPPDANQMTPPITTHAATAPYTNF